MKYKFITFEGVDGSGKSTQAKLLHEFLITKNYDAIITREPGGTLASEQIRKILIDEKLPKLESKTELLLNFAARIEHVEKLIKPALKENKIVICDRFFDSTFAYQGNGFGVDFLSIKTIQEIAIGNFKPDITFLIDVKIEDAFLRTKNRNDNNRYEKLDLDFHKKTREGFLNLAQNNERIKIIDGTKTIVEISQQIQKELLRDKI